MPSSTYLHSRPPRQSKISDARPNGLTPTTALADHEAELKRKREELLRKCQDKIRYTFNDPNLLWEALQGADSEVVTIDKREVPQHNLRLAFVGDAVLMLALRMQSFDRGDLTGPATKMCQYSATNEFLTRVGMAAGIHQVINSENYMLRLWGPTGKSVADTMEAILGAVLYDGGIDKVISVMATLGVKLPASPGDVPRADPLSRSKANRLQKRLQLDQQMAVNNLAKAEQRVKTVSNVLVASSQDWFAPTFADKGHQGISDRLRHADQYQSTYAGPPRPVWTAVNAPAIPPAQQQTVKAPNVPSNVPQHKAAIERPPLHRPTYDGPPRPTCADPPRPPWSAVNALAALSAQQQRTESFKVPSNVLHHQATVERTTLPSKEAAHVVTANVTQSTTTDDSTKEMSSVQEEEAPDNHIFGVGSIRSLLERAGKPFGGRSFEPVKPIKPTKSAHGSASQVTPSNQMSTICKFGMAGFSAMQRKTVSIPVTVPKQQSAIVQPSPAEIVTPPLRINTDAVDEMDEEDEWLREYMDYVGRKHGFRSTPVTTKEVHKAKSILIRVRGEEVKIRKPKAQRSMDFPKLLGYLPAGHCGQKRRKLEELSEAPSVSGTGSSVSSE